MEKKFYTNRELAEYFFNNWQKGIKELGRGFLTRHYEQNGDNSRLKLCEKYEKELSGSKTDGITQLYSLLYSLSSGNTAVYWKNYHFDSLTSYAKAVIAAVVHNKDPELVKSVVPMLSEKVLKTYAETQLSGILANDTLSALLLVLENNVKLISSDPLEEYSQALRFGYSITGEENFKIGSYIYESTADFRNRLTSVYKSDLKAFMKFFSENGAEIEFQGRLFTGEAKTNYDAILSLKNNVVILPSGDVFRNHADILQYQKKLWDENKLQLFSGFYSCNRDYLKLHSAEFRDADPELFAEISSFRDNMFNIDEHFFKSSDDFVDYACTLIECQVKYNSSIYERFFEMHSDSVNKVTLERDDIKTAQGKIKKTYELLLDSEKSQKKNKVAVTNVVDDGLLYNQTDCDTFLKRNKFVVGQVITFGKYFKNSMNTKESLEWRILEIEENLALLVTKYVIDCKQYNRVNTIVSWYDCDLRKWCNNDFIRDAFSEVERNAIVTTKNQNNYGPRTDDLVFCLSIDEAEKYFKHSRDRICEFTPYASKNRSCIGWWLRSRSYFDLSAIFGFSASNHFENGASWVLNPIGGIQVGTDFDGIKGVRLACRINLDLLP